ncbi:MAG: ABC transporter substrate-binding protein, partial [Candidatus Lustribacter sp.]
KIIVASTPSEAGAEVYYASALGFFTQAGLDVDVRTIDNGAAVASAVAGGAVDIGQSNVVSIATAHEKGLPFVVIAPAGMYSSAAPTTLAFVAKNAPFKTVKDLAGKTFATNGLFNIGQIAGDAWLERNGVDVKSVKWVEVPVAATGAAVSTGRVDVGLVSEPVLGETLATGQFRVFGDAYSAIGSHWLIGAWFTTSSWALAHPDLARKFLAVLVRTARWANGHHAESLKILEQYNKRTFPSNMARTTYAETLDPALIQPVIDNAAKYGALSASFPASDLFARL